MVEIGKEKLSGAVSIVKFGKINRRVFPSLRISQFSYAMCCRTENSDEDSEGTYNTFSISITVELGRENFTVPTPFIVVFVFPSANITWLVAAWTGHFRR